MIDLSAKPFGLDTDAIRWVEETKAEMTLEEKVGQLFVPIGYSGEHEYIDNAMLRYHIGGILFRTGEAAEMQETHRYLQQQSKIPLLIAANLESGGDGIAVEGTPFGKQMQAAAANNPDHGYHLGKIACCEGKAVGCNWAFAPVVDIDMNYHNPITNVRTFGNNPNKVLEYALAYKRGADEEGVAVSVKHFPGDGWDEVDQHILTSVNGLSCEEWTNSFGKVYKGMIDAGALTVMAGHIAQPAWQARLSGEESKSLIPATLSKELLQGLLRKELAFNGLIVTDSTCMVGFTVAMPRHMAVPHAIEAGCDMFLFNKDLGEDYGYMLKGAQDGLLSAERLDEAITRILATKAALDLHTRRKEDLVPDTSALAVLQNSEHLAWAKQCADEAVTLVKDTQNLLPISAAKTPKVLLQALGNYPTSPRILEQFKNRLEQAGFAVTLYEKENFPNVDFKVETFKSRYDMVFIVGNMENASNQVTNRYQWYTFWGNGDNVPWYTAERPVLYVSMANPYALLDAPQIKTYINCYSGNEYVIDACMDKLLGNSEFVGVSPVDPLCGKEYLAY